MSIADQKWKCVKAGFAPSYTDQDFVASSLEGLGYTCTIQTLSPSPEPEEEFAPEPEKEVVLPEVIDPPEEGPEMIVWVCDKEGFAPAFETTANPGVADSLMALGWVCYQLPQPVPDVPGEQTRVWNEFFGHAGMPADEEGVPDAARVSLPTLPAADSIHWPVFGLLILVARFV